MPDVRLQNMSDQKFRPSDRNTAPPAVIPRASTRAPNRSTASGRDAQSTPEDAATCRKHDVSSDALSACTCPKAGLRSAGLVMSMIGPSSQYRRCVHHPESHRSSESGVSCWADAAAPVSSGAAAGCADVSTPTHAGQAQCDTSQLHRLQINMPH